MDGCLSEVVVYREDETSSLAGDHGKKVFCCRKMEAVKRESFRVVIESNYQAAEWAFSRHESRFLLGLVATSRHGLSIHQSIIRCGRKIDNSDQCGADVVKKSRSIRGSCSEAQDSSFEVKGSGTQ